MEYELLYNGEVNSDELQLMGLLDPQKLTYDDKKLEQNTNKLPPSWGQVGPKLDQEKSLEATNGMAHGDSGLASSKNTLRAL